MLTYEQGHKAARLMEETGGGFASAIAWAFYKADSHNARILLEAYEDMFMRFYDLAVQAEQARDADIDEYDEADTEPDHWAIDR